LPTYEYRCDSCAKNFDVVQSFQDDPLTSCPTCGSPVRKVFGNVGIVFKGSGFYKTDSRSGGSTNGSEGSGTDGGGDAKPAASGGDAAAKAPASDSSSTPAPTPSPTPSNAPAKPSKSASSGTGS
jgi:putative FmdB family regulatory protein